LVNAVRLMYFGAVVALLGTIFTLAISSKIKTDIFNAVRKNNRAAHGSYTIAQLHTVANLTFLALVVGGFISVLLWWWMAWADNRGSGWARIAASVLFALITIEAVLSHSRASVSIFVIVLEWVIGLGAVLLLWRRETTQFIGPA
jgi:ABC-type transport system involved in cytochrome bd biosynthesis fused ATPase/permease subunit